MDRFDAELEANRRRWSEMAEIHAGVESYGVDAFLDGQTTLNHVEREEVGDVSGKSLLHLMCHFGLDTLSWAREGAAVTGVDFAGAAVETARELAAEADLDARFVCADVYDVPDRIEERFDVVFLSYGVLDFLPDLDELAAVAASRLEPGGCFYMIENHPVASMLDEIDEDGWGHFAYPYFHSAEPHRYVDDSTYADPEATLEHDVTYNWDHGLGDVINALLSAGLELEFVHEFPHAESEAWLRWPNFANVPGPREDENGDWRIGGVESDVPLRFSVKARKGRAD